MPGTTSVYYYYTSILNSQVFVQFSKLSPSCITNLQKNPSKFLKWMVKWKKNALNL